MGSGRSAELEEIWALFAQESRDNLSLAEQTLLTLEQDASDMEQIKVLFRAVHSFKGGVRMMGLSALETLAHRSEDLIALVRDDGVALQSDMVDVLLAVLDRLRVMLTEVLTTGQDADAAQTDELVGRITEIIHRVKPPAPPAAAEPALAESDATSVAAEPAAPEISETVAGGADLWPAAPAVSEPDPFGFETAPVTAEPAAPDANAPATDLGAFLHRAEMALTRVHAALDGLATGDPAAGQEIRSAAADLKQAATPFGYQRVIGVLDDLIENTPATSEAPLDDSRLIDLKRLELSLFEELTRIQDTFTAPGAVAQSGWTDIAWLFRHWNAEKAFTDLTRLSQIAETLDRSDLPGAPQAAPLKPIAIVCEEAALLLRALYHSSIFYNLDRAVHLTLALEDLYRRVGQGEVKVTRYLPHLTHAYVMNLGSAIDSIREGEEPQLDGFQDVIDQIQDFVYQRGGDMASRDILDLLGLPPGFRDVTTPEALEQMHRAYEAGEHFYTVLADLQRNEMLGDALLNWSRSQPVHLITNVTVYRYRRTLFNFLLSTTLSRDALLQSLSELDPRWQSLTVRECVVRQPAAAERTREGAEVQAPVESAAVSVPIPSGAPLAAASLDGLMETIGEMVAEYATLHRVLDRLGDTDLPVTVRRLFTAAGGDRAATQSELERCLEGWNDHYRALTQVDSAMGTALGRLQDAAHALQVAPASEILQPLNGLVQELSRVQDKPIELALQGAELELDRSAMLALADPIGQLVRFAAWHGIETAERRQASGKPAAGQIAVRIRPREDYVEVEVEDDGQGLDRDLIRRRAPADASDGQELDRVFQPGFGAIGEGSTAVDLAAIQSRLQARQAKMSVTSTPGQGTRFMIRLPLDRAVVDGMVVRVGEVHYVVPVAVIRRIVKTEAGQLVHSSAEGDQTFLRQGDEMMPVRALAGGGGRTADAQLLVIVENEGVQTALVIDELVGRQQVLVRPLQGQFKDVADASACALLGEGQVGLVLKHGG